MADTDKTIAQLQDLIHTAQQLVEAIQPGATGQPEATEPETLDRDERIIAAARAWVANALSGDPVNLWAGKEDLALIKAVTDAGETADTSPSDTITQLRQGLWDVYKTLGFDTDGEETPAAVTNLVTVVTKAAQEFRDDCDQEYARIKDVIENHVLFWVDRIMDMHAAPGKHGTCPICGPRAWPYGRRPPGSTNQCLTYNTAKSAKHTLIEKVLA
jgi:hypothetical protein